MGLILAYDSGEKTGWAMGRDGAVIGCGLVYVYPDKPMHPIPLVEKALVYVEKPIHRRQGKTVDPNNLITLGIKVGRLVEPYLVLGNDVRTVFPHEWKGSVKKNIQNARDQQELTREEWALVNRIMAKIPEGYQNNVWDAIGILLWAMFRHKERERS